MRRGKGPKEWWSRRRRAWDEWVILPLEADVPSATLDGNVELVSRFKGDVGFIDVRVGRSGVDEGLKDTRIVVEANVDRDMIDQRKWTD